MFEEAGRKIFCHKTKQFTILLQENYMGWVGDFGRLLHNSEYPIKSEQNQSILYIYYLSLQLSYKDNFQKKVRLFFHSFYFHRTKVCTPWEQHKISSFNLSDGLKFFRKLSTTIISTRRQYSRHNWKNYLARTNLENLKMRINALMVAQVLTWLK